MPLRSTRTDCSFSVTEGSASISQFYLAVLPGFVRFNAARGPSRPLSNFAVLEHGSSAVPQQLHWGNLSTGLGHQLRFCVCQENSTFAGLRALYRLL